MLSPVYLTPQPCLTGSSTRSISQQSTASPTSSASWKNSATTFAVTIYLATSPLHRLICHSPPQSTATATTGTYQVGAGMGPGLRTGTGLIAPARAQGQPSDLLAWHLPIQRSGFLSLTFAMSGTFWSPLIFTLCRILCPISRINLFSSAFLSL